MKKQYNHEEVTKLLEQMEACVGRMQKIRKNFEHAISHSTKKAA
ncbi:hypothetical protein VCSRO18_3340 [Vibrio cholerae]|nr:hypothetical protein [Vibrio cholerae]GIA39263.1 hypothetical protein VCSRO18_3340 [Vibrio cholerae]